MNFAGYEPCLDDVLHEPIVQLLMQSDGADALSVRAILERVQKRPPLRADASSDLNWHEGANEAISSHRNSAIHAGVAKGSLQYCRGPFVIFES